MNEERIMRRLGEYLSRAGVLRRFGLSDGELPYLVRVHLCNEGDLDPLLRAAREEDANGLWFTLCTKAAAEVGRWFVGGYAKGNDEGDGERPRRGSRAGGLPSVLRPWEIEKALDPHERLHAKAIGNAVARRARRTWCIRCAGQRLGSDRAGWPERNRPAICVSCFRDAVGSILEPHGAQTLVRSPLARFASFTQIAEMGLTPCSPVRFVEGTDWLISPTEVTSQADPAVRGTSITGGGITEVPPVRPGSLGLSVPSLPESWQHDARTPSACVTCATIADAGSGRVWCVTSPAVPLSREWPETPLDTWDEPDEDGVDDSWEEVVFPGSVVHLLSQLSEWLHRHLPWAAPEAAWFVLTDAVPDVLPMAAKSMPSRALTGTGSRRGPGERPHRTITIVAESWLSANTIQQVYRGLQQRSLGDGSDLRSTHRKTMAVVRFVEEQGGRGQTATWTELLRRWNETYPDYPYKTFSGLRRAYKGAKAARSRQVRAGVSASDAGSELDAEEAGGGKEAGGEASEASAARANPRG